MKSRLVALLLVLPAVVVGQGIRVSGVTSAQFIELRPLYLDSTGVESSGARVTAAPVLQDITFTAWGLGEGLSLRGNVRLRTQLASDGLVYPGSNDHVDLLDLYAEMDRASWRGRLGRQWITGGLGVYDFDGADLLLRRGTLTVEGWGGRALEAGLFESYTSSELASVENRPPEQEGYLVGARARLRPNPFTSFTLMYQRVRIADGSGLYSERAAFDASTRGHGAAVDVAATYDFAAAHWNEARVRVGTAATRDVGYSAEIRHSQPFFELWTIWGAFAPVGFDEARATVDWRPRALAFSFAFHGGYRRYGDTQQTGIDLRTNGWRAGADANWLGGGAFSASGSYDVDVGFGASRSDGRARLRWTKSSDLSFGLEGSALQNIYEFRVGTGRVFGILLDGTTRLTSDVRLTFDVGLYRNMESTGAVGPDWTQRRASLRCEWALGADPGAGVGKAP
jgi:hypothetical protein